MGESVIFKNSAQKVRRIYGGKVILGFAGSVSDAFSLSEKFEGMLNKFSGNLMRSAVELAELWRADKARKLEALMIVADKARRRNSGDRQRRQLRSGGGARTVPEHKIHRARNSAKVTQNRKRNLRVHKRQHQVRSNLICNRAKKFQNANPKQRLSKSVII